MMPNSVCYNQQTKIEKKSTYSGLHDSDFEGN